MKKKKKLNNTDSEELEVSAAEDVQADLAPSTESAADEVISTDELLSSEDVSVVEADDKAESVKEDEDTEEKTRKEKRPLGQTPRLVITLTAICVIIAILLGVVNAATKDKIDENTLRSKEISILAIFDAGTSCELYKTCEDGSEIYLVYKDTDIIGYCVFLTATGFGGDIDMTVGIDAELNTCGVQIVTMSETPGVGTKTKTPDFLNKFIGLSHSDPVSAVDAISGATISSEAVKSGVAAAHAIEFDLAAVASEKGVKLLSPADLAAEAETSAQSESESQSLQNDTASSETLISSGTASQDTDEEPKEETSDIPYVDNGGEGYYIYGVDATTVDDRYVIEINKDDETATFETETETEEPETTKEDETTKKAETTKAPETTKKTETTKAPETTKKTETTPEPVTTPEPETTIPPETETPTEESTTDPISPDTSDSADTEDPIESELSTEDATDALISTEADGPNI